MESRPTNNEKTPVEVDVPELLSAVGMLPSSNKRDRAIGDLTLITFYYLLCIGEYTIKSACNQSKQTVQFCLQDVRFFCNDTHGHL